MFEKLNQIIFVLLNPRVVQTQLCAQCLTTEMLIKIQSWLFLKRDFVQATKRAFTTNTVHRICVCVFAPTARPVSLALPSRAPMVTPSTASLKKSTTLPSSTTTRNYSPTPPRRYPVLWEGAGDYFHFLNMCRRSRCVFSKPS